MSVQELRAVLHEHAQAVPDTRIVGRAAAARRRAVNIRWRRRGAVALVAAVVAPLVGAALLHDSSSRSDGSPVHRGDLSQVHVAEGFAGRELIASKVSDGEEIVLQVPGGDRTEMHMACWGAGPQYTVHFTWDGADLHAEPCLVVRPDISQMSYGGIVLDPRSAHALRVWVTPGSTDLPARPEGAFLMAAAYRAPTAVAHVAHTPVTELEHAYQDDYKLAKFEQSEPGARTFRSTFTADDWVLPTIYTSVSPEGEGAEVTLLLDGVRKESLTLWGRGYQITERRYIGRHRIELRIRGDVPPDAVLGVVWRTVQR